MVTMVITALWDSDTLKDCHLSDEGSRFLQNISNRIHSNIPEDSHVCALWVDPTLQDVRLNICVKKMN